MKKTVVWENNEFFGLENMELSNTDHKINIESSVISFANKYPYKLNYRISLDNNWIVRQIAIEINNLNTSLHVSSNGKGQWFDEKGNDLPHLDGAIDIDLSCTPFTNSLPINRSKWIQNVPLIFEMVFISVPDLTLKKVDQHYTLIDEKP
ncbi:putative glycolipid-binding domain-containing protein [Jeotgalibacillus soli]|uniref:Glycolipid-binding domain-containing protein n=1 Tax=Jeotgalibacillus soli TaxID=889306 RepID=A0A0C2V828_9BACL|nr:putative glycolipid-binding domain-containing protein [Jeotgalibacillus soli]KIL45112.1 hypothetical protein KP78_26560 [Jeotgalibacillus soli]